MSEGSLRGRGDEMVFLGSGWVGLYRGILAYGRGSNAVVMSVREVLEEGVG